MASLADSGAGMAVHRSQPHTEDVATRAATHRPHRLSVDDVMTRDVVTVPPTATFHEMVGLMAVRGISALPVVDQGGDLVGIVSEADLLLKESAPPPRRQWLREGSRSADLRRKADAVDAAGVMTTPVVSVRSGAPVVAAVRLLREHQVKRLVVLGVDNRMVGIVSRHDLLAGFSRSDDEIRADIVDGVIPRWLLVDPVHVRVAVRGGVVRLEGTVERRSDAEVLPHLVRGLDGVVDVESALDYVLDDRNLSPSREHRIS